MAALSVQANAAEDTFTVFLPRLGTTLDPDTDCTDYSETECIEIPNGRPIYALLVSGFHQNKNLDMFHWYNFAKYLQERGAYVHHAWWNNLLAPYMERPLHNPNSVPSTGPLPVSDMINLLPFPALIDKAIPAEDHQFQQDATILLNKIREKNPDAIVILVGHSMGGCSVVRLADNMDNFVIDLLAPIDPVGNRSCVSNYSWGGGDFCNGLLNFTRWRALHEDWMTDTIFLYDPPRRAFTDNIKYLYHRWQQEFAPPFDYSCPEGGNELNWPCLSGKPESEYLFIHPATLETSIPDIHDGSTNVQSMIDTDLDSGKDVPEIGFNIGGGLDGHGEIVGFRGVIPFTSDSYPLALECEGDWPSRDKEGDLNDPNDPERVRRIQILKAWETDPGYLYKKGFEPWNPGLCMVSRDLCNILDTIIGPPNTLENEPPVADAGADQTVSVGSDCNAIVTLDGLGSHDPDGDTLTYSWRWDGQEVATGVNPMVELSLGVYTIELIVNDGQAGSLPDQVVITAIDTTAPVLTCPADAVLECPGDTSVEANGSATAIDNCDDPVKITHKDEVTPGPGKTEAVVRTWTAIDASGNSSSCEQVIVVEDTTAPEFSVSVKPAVLWPANHKMVRITASIQVSDPCDDSPTVELVSITSNEPDNGTGDGNTKNDIKGAKIGKKDRKFSLRAERTGKESGRIYTIHYRATDASGNVANSTAEVIVSHDKGK